LSACGSPLGAASADQPFSLPASLLLRVPLTRAGQPLVAAVFAAPPRVHVCRLLPGAVFALPAALGRPDLVTAARSCNQAPFPFGHFLVAPSIPPRPLPNSTPVPFCLLFTACFFLPPFLLSVSRKLVRFDFASADSQRLFSFKLSRYPAPTALVCFVSFSRHLMFHLRNTAALVSCGAGFVTPASRRHRCPSRLFALSFANLFCPAAFLGPASPVAPPPSLHYRVVFTRRLAAALPCRFRPR